MIYISLIEKSYFSIKKKMETKESFEIKTPCYPSTQCLFTVNGKQCEEKDEEYDSLLCLDHYEKVSPNKRVDLAILWEKQKYEACDKEALHKEAEKAVLEAFELGSGQESFLPRSLYFDKGRIIFPDEKKYVIKLVEEK